MKRSSDGSRRLILSSAVLLLGLGATSACSGEREPHPEEDAVEEAAVEEVGTSSPTLEAVPSPREAQSPVGGEASSVSSANPGTSSPAPEEPPVRALPEGSLLVFQVTEPVSTSSHQAGDAFELRLLEPVRGPSGAYLPTGTRAMGVVTQAQRSPSSQEEAVLSVEVREVELDGSFRRVRGTVEAVTAEASTRDSGARTAAKVATGAAAGAVVGRILGGDSRSAVTGAVVGTAAGAGIAVTTRDGHAELERGAVITLRLDEDLVLARR